VLISVVESLDALATDIPEAGRKLCEAFWPGPLTVICHAQTSLMWDLGDTQGTVALRVPDHENTRELLSRTGPLAVSSANLSGQPAATDVYDAEAQLLDSVAVYLDGGPVSGGEPSTIVDLTGDTPYVVRVGALSLERLREVVPEVTSAFDSAPTDDQKPADDKSVTDAKSVTDDQKPADDKSVTDAKSVTDNKQAGDNEFNAGDKQFSDDTPTTDDEPARHDGAVQDKDAEPAADDKPVNDEKPVTDDKPVDTRPAD
jgi:L-threonylcarbamoyladenylate synthase